MILARTQTCAEGGAGHAVSSFLNRKTAFLEVLGRGVGPVAGERR